MMSGSVHSRPPHPASTGDHLAVRRTPSDRRSDLGQPGRASDEHHCWPETLTPGSAHDHRFGAFAARSVRSCTQPAIMLLRRPARGMAAAERRAPVDITAGPNPHTGPPPQRSQPAPRRAGRRGRARTRTAPSTPARAARPRARPPAETSRRPGSPPGRPGRSRRRTPGHTPTRRPATRPPPRQPPTPDSRSSRTSSRRRPRPAGGCVEQPPTSSRRVAPVGREQGREGHAIQQRGARRTQLGGGVEHGQRERGQPDAALLGEIVGPERATAQHEPPPGPRWAPRHRDGDRGRRPVQQPVPPRGRSPRSAPRRPRPTAARPGSAPRRGRPPGREVDLRVQRDPVPAAQPVVDRARRQPGRGRLPARDHPALPPQDAVDRHADLDSGRPDAVPSRPGTGAIANPPRQAWG